MITAEVPTTLDSAVPTFRPYREALIHPSAFHCVAPWKYTALLKLHDLERSTPPDLLAHGLAVSIDAVMFARTILDSVTRDNLPTPEVCPVSGGDVAVIWSVGDKQLEAIFAPDRTGSYVLSHGEEIVEDGEVSVDNAVPLIGALEDILAA